ncbi:MAG: adenylate/guanylate cyclase domain-containing protein [Elusimicrobiota bacterium]|nr:adenylate/guanylate cyclase domain-containing protein [Elusimicrobiota bacterium]
MTAKTEKAERKKKMEEFTRILAVPVILTLVNSIFFKMAMAAFAGHPASDGALVRISAGAHALSAVFGFQFGIMTLLVYLWGRPADLYVRNPDEKLKEKIRVRLGNIYRDAFLMLFIVQAVSLVISSLAPGTVSRAEYAAAGVAFLAQAALLVVYIDAHLSKQKNLMEALYSPGELSRLRSGFSIPVYIKISTLVLGFAILPFFLVYMTAYNRVPWDAFYMDLIYMLGISAALLLNGLSSIYSGMQVPLDGLIAKMKRVAGGEFVKTRIYFSDEVAHLKAGFNEMVDGLKEREELQATFGKYLSIEIARELIMNKKVNLGGEDMEAAVMFCDIRNFTPLSEKMSASMLIDFLNSYFHYITPPIAVHNGVINKFMGDAVMAIYTPLLGSDDYAADAVRAAVAMRKALAEFNASGKAPARVDFGIGVHAGKLVAGNVGTAARLEYTFIGDTVNIASRLESKTKDLNTDIIVSGAALEMARSSLAGSVVFEPLGKVALKGKADTMELYKVA